MSDKVVNLSSFGFKYGIPDDAFFVFDVRCLPNPYWVESMRDMSGLDREVREYVFASGEAREYLELIFQTIIKCLSMSAKTEHNVYVGCTGGRHRSVSAAILLATKLSESGIVCKVSHRDLNKKDIC